MTHWRSMFDSKYLKAWDLRGKDRTVTIERAIPQEEITGEKGRKDKVGLLYFKDIEKGFILNIINSKSIARLYGTDFEEWVGKKITLYAIQTENKEDEVVDAIRIRPSVMKRAETIPTEPAAPPLKSSLEFLAEDDALGDALDDPKGDPS